MPTPILATKLYIPLQRPKIVLRPRLIERLNEGLRQNQGFGRKLTLVSAPAGFGKTTLVGEWIQALGGATSPIAVAWLSLDEGDSDPIRFLTYFVAALQRLVLSDVEGIAARQPLAGNVGKRVLAMLQSPKPPPTESILTVLLNEIAAIPYHFILVLDDYHVLDARAVAASTSVDHVMSFLLEHQPPQMHLVIATREDPNLPLARLRARDQLAELRVADLRFTLPEAAGFLNQVMGLNLSVEDVAALEARTEGWIAGLQLAALALQSLAAQSLALRGTLSTQGYEDATGFIKSFAGSHRFVLDYLVEEVLGRQPTSVQTFLLRTSILERLCGSLCDEVVGAFEGWDGSASSPRDRENFAPSSERSKIFTFKRSSEILEYLEHANLFIVPLDDQRCWYRYHHLFAGLLQQRLHEQQPDVVAELHIRASRWYEGHGLEIEAFRHATLANDIERAARLVEGKGMPLQFRGAVAPVLRWLASLPTTVLDARPSLWVMYASALSMTGQTTGVEQKLQAAETALQDAEQDDVTRNLIGHIAAIRALLAATQNQVETIIAQSRRALEYLHPDNLAVRTATIWKLGIAYHLQGERAAASQAYSEAIAISQASGNIIVNISATTGLARVQESENQLDLASQTYQSILQLVGDQPQPAACEAHLGLARIFYEWNDLDNAQQHGDQGVQLARLLENNDRLVAGKVVLARLKLAWGDAAGADALLIEAEQSLRRDNFVHQIPEVAAAQVLTLLRQGNLAAAARLAEKHELPISQGRVLLAQGDPSAALAALEPVRRQMEAKGWQDERLKVMVLQAVALHAQGKRDQAVQLLGEALALAQPGNFIRTFIDEGLPMAQLLSDAAARGMMVGYTGKLLAVFEAEQFKGEGKSPPPSAQPLIEPLSQRELEVLQLIAQGLSNHQISERLFLAMNTVKGHNRKIFGKLQVQRRTEAVARARELGLV